MPMTFVPAGKAVVPNYAEAEMMAAQLRQQEMQQEQAMYQSNMEGAAGLVQSDIGASAWDSLKSLGTGSETGAGNLTFNLGEGAGAGAEGSLWSPEGVSMAEQLGTAAPSQQVLGDTAMTMMAPEMSAATTLGAPMAEVAPAGFGMESLGLGASLEAAGAAELAGAGTGMIGAGGTGLAAAEGAGALAAAETAGVAGAGGMGSTLGLGASMGPVGWAGLAALGLGLALS